MADLERLYRAVLDGDVKAAVEATRQALAEGGDPHDLIAGAMAPAMDEAGRRYEADEYFVPDLLLAAQAMKGALELLRPLMGVGGTGPGPLVAIGTVEGDLHDIGKNLVASMLEGGGFEVLDLGTNVPPEAFVDAVRSRGAQLVALSALLTVTMRSMRTTVEALRDAGLRERVKVMVGGAPITQRFADEIGADGYAENAAAAVGLARRLAGVQPLAS